MISFVSAEEDLFPHVFAWSWFTESVQQMRKKNN